MKKRLSLDEIRQEDERNTSKATPPPTTPSATRSAAKRSIMNHGRLQSEIGPPKAEFRNPKADFIKISVTLPPATFDKVEDLSRARRRARQPYTVSAIVREALEAYFRSA